MINVVANKCEIIVGLIEMNQALKKTIIWAVDRKERVDIQNKIALNNIKIEKLKGGK